MTTTYIVRKSASSPDLKDRPGYERFGQKRGGRPQGSPRRSNNRGGGGRPPRARKRGNGQEMAVDLSKLINKAKPQEPEAVFVPKHKFTDFPVDATLKENIAAKGYEKP